MTRRDQIIRLAEQVMGWRVEPRTSGGWFLSPLDMCRYSLHKDGWCDWNPYTSLTDAWMLVEAIQAKGCTVTITCAPEPINGWRRCAAQIRKEIRNRNEFTFARDGDTAPDAICAAALRFVEVIEESNG